MPPDPGLRAVVVVPARDEQERIGDCLRALAEQREVEPGAFEVVLVLDHCADDTRARALEAAAEWPSLPLSVLESDRPGAGHARRVGMDFACERLLAAGRPDGLIASTDADSRVAPDWLVTQLVLASEGARAIGGWIELDPREASALAPAVLEERGIQAGLRLARVRARASGAASGHHHFSGASLAVTAQTYLEVGGLPCGEALEDEAFERALEDRGIHILRTSRVHVTTSARTDGRASRGLARDLALADWRARRSFRADEFTIAGLLARKTGPISAILPAREVAATIAPILDALAGLREDGLLDEILVVDAASQDGTALAAAAHGATVLQEDELLPDYGPARGKGDAMWRALSVARGETVVFLDADTSDFDASFAVGLLGPLLVHPEIRFVKGAFLRPLQVAGSVLPGQGGRVTELVARPLLNLYAPHLAGFDQPLAGELAARADLLRALAFPAGYGVEIANLIDAARVAGIDALAQVDLGTRQNRHQPLRDLSAMSYAVMVAAAARLHGAGLPPAPVPGPLALPPLPGETALELRQVPVLERPPLDSLDLRPEGARLALDPGSPAPVDHPPGPRWARKLRGARTSTVR
ncbi:MAG TPA: glucosyl-3-phosphoglycerate synthase [Solirubrobacteraceae bacterium]|jgi:glycosyltransferase involved in cell wall biosynthesis|nr:glucosyl-3-phosphoglycerate synthase [Solirubrobacteraceae bacterium]